MTEQLVVDLERRFGGVVRLYGAVGAQRIRQAHVAVVGIGGVGSWAAEALARSGVGALTLVDLDHVAESNINRQIHALTPTLGQAKVAAMQARIAQIHPACQVQMVDEFVTSDNWPVLLPDGVQVVIDACDQVLAKVAMCAWARQSSMPLITVGAAGGRLQGEKVQIADVADTTHDPLIAQLRYRLRRHHGAPKGGQRIGVPAVFSTEMVRKPQACELGCDMDRSLNCHGYGSSVTVTAVFGLCAAGWALNYLSQKNIKPLL